MTDTLVNIAPGCYIDPASVESIKVTYPYEGWCSCGGRKGVGHESLCAGQPFHVVQVMMHGGRYHRHAGALGDDIRYFDEADAIIDADKLAQLLMMPDQELYRP